MPKPPRLHASARRELTAAVAWYAEQREGLGEELLDAVGSALTSITDAPLSMPLYRAGPYRKALVPRFPYTVFYLVDPRGIVRVAAIAHHKRRQGYWGKRRV